MIHIYYGYGKGKTTSCIGAGVRAYGAGLKVMLVQFLKNNKSSELKALPFEVYNAPESLPFNPSESYQPWVNDAIAYVKSSCADMIILDEFLDIIDNFISVNEAVELIKDLRVTVIIRTRQKFSIKAIFVAFAVALRQQGCHLKAPNLIFTPSIFDALQFIVCRFGLNQGKNAVNPFGLTSILTKSKDNICHYKPWFGLLPLP